MRLNRYYSREAANQGGIKRMGKDKGIKRAIIAVVILAMLVVSGCATFNNPPVIAGLTSSATSLAPGGSCSLSCTASDPNGDTLTYQWTTTGGTISGAGSTVTWLAPTAEGTYTINVTASDGKGGTASRSLTIDVVNTPPVIANLTSSATSLAPEASCSLSCTASDPDGDTLTYQWTTTGGTISGEGSAVTWLAPAAEGTYTISVTVSDGKGGTASQNLTINVETKFGSIDIQSTPAGATIYLDGANTGNITPYTITNLTPGSYTIKLEFFHYKYREETITVNAEQTTYINWSLTPAPEEELTIQPDAADGKDASVDTYYPDQNYATHTEIGAGRGTADTVRAYIEFDLSSIPDNVVITSAAVGLYYYRTVGSATAPIGVYLVEESWTESNTTWNHQPDSATTPEDTLTVPTSVTNAFLYWDITDLVKDWLDGTIDNNGVMFRDTDESTVEAWKGFYSSDYGTPAQRPQLIIEYFDPTP
jgi:hypothetical protein